MLGLPELVILGAAAARGTQLITDDSILDGTRARLAVWHADKVDSKVRTFIVDLTSCLFCIGFWCSTAALLVYLVATDQWGAAPWIVHAVEAFAVAAIQMTINMRINTWAHS